MTEAVVTTTSLQTSTEPPKELRLFAQSPDQLVAEQNRLIDWFDRKIESVTAHRDELQANLDIAKKAKWRVGTLRKAVALETKRIAFYDKMQFAVRSGFFIVPNLQAEVFAVRTAAGAPDGETNTSRSSWGSVSGNMPVKELLEAGEGRNVDATRTMQRSGSYEEERAGKKETVRWAYSTEFIEEIDFPFSLARSEILSATQHALALKVFDEVAAVPPTRRADPMVIGRIYDPRDKYKQRHVTFLIAWFLDTETL